MSVIRSLDFNGLQRLTPSRLVSADTSSGPVRVSGVDTAGLNASVGVFVEGVNRSRSAAVREHLFAVETVEILRGSVGTAFGENTVASFEVLYSAFRRGVFDPASGAS